MRWSNAKSQPLLAVTPARVAHFVSAAIVSPSEELSSSRKRLEALRNQQDRLTADAHDIADRIRDNDQLIRAEQAKIADLAVSLHEPLISAAVQADIASEPPPVSDEAFGEQTSKLETAE